MKAKLTLVDKDRGYEKIVRELKRVAKGSPYIRLGVIGGGEVALIALVHEFGSEKRSIPERSWLRSAIDRHRGWSALREKLLKAVFEGKLSAEQALGLLGQQAVADIRAGIVAGIPPPLSPKTIAAKGSDKTLIDSGRFFGSISYQVTKAKAGE